jgi:hypothetical protein
VLISGKDFRGFRSPDHARSPDHPIFKAPSPSLGIPPHPKPSQIGVHLSYATQFGVELSESPFVFLLSFVVQGFGFPITAMTCDHGDVGDLTLA